jgi:hypothetical protein
MTAYMMVRATVPEIDRQPFDRWYEEKHLREAVIALRAVGAWRGWSEVDPSLHYAFYELGDVAAVRAGLQSDAFKGLIADFDQAWGTRVPRSREIVASKQTISS